jgi:WD40 repeat protein
VGKDLRAFEGHDDKVASLSLSRDGRRLLTGSRDGTALVWTVPAPPAK